MHTPHVHPAHVTRYYCLPGALSTDRGTARVLYAFCAETHAPLTVDHRAIEASTPGHMAMLLSGLYPEAESEEAS